MIVVFPDHSHLLFFSNLKYAQNKNSLEIVKLFKVSTFTENYLQNLHSEVFNRKNVMCRVMSILNERWSEDMFSSVKFWVWGSSIDIRSKYHIVEVS